jgi:hypothetical protein
MSYQELDSSRDLANSGAAVQGCNRLVIQIEGLRIPSLCDKDPDNYYYAPKGHSLHDSLLNRMETIEDIFIGLDIEAFKK